MAFAIGYLIFGILLWCFSDKLAVMMVKPKSDDDEEEQGMVKRERDLDMIQRAAFSVVGLFFIGNALPKVIGLLGSVYLAVINHNPVSYLLINSAGIIAELIIGAAFFLGAQGLVNIINKGRNLGLDIDDQAK